MYARLLVVMWSVASVVAWADESAPAAVQPSPQWHRVVGLLQYLEGDYANALASKSADELLEQKTMAGEAVTTLKTLEAAGAQYLPDAEALEQAVSAQTDAATVTAQARALALRIVKDVQLPQAPRHSPDLVHARELFATQCAACHGATGHGDGPAAAGLQPPPANFHDPARMQTLTPYKVFNTTTFGIAGTAMTPFQHLSDDDRWSLAFLVLQLRQPPCDGPAVTASLPRVSTATDLELAQQFGADRVACIRALKLAADDASVLAVARAGLQQALTLSKQGHHDDARRALIDAYLTGFEPLEPALRARNPQLLSRVEQEFSQARLAAEQGRSFEAQVSALDALFAQVGTSAAVADFWSIFFAALLILIREGFEATVVVGALLALMKKMNATEHVRVVHAGWVSALIAGALAFIFGHAFFAGANREWLETSVALAAVVMLLYAALWLNARATMSRFMTEMREKMKDALGRGSMLGLFMISFSSVGRESVETVLFLEGLAGDSRSGALWGAFAGLLVLLGLVLLVRRVGYVLPMKSMFTASTILLVVTAIALLGKGVHGLQELGVLSVHPVMGVTVMPLGLFPDAVSLGAQLALTLVVIGWSRRPVRRQTA